jgi:type IV pilus assembly protein PilM
MLMLPAGMYDEEMEMQVETEAGQTLPFSLDEISLDFVTVGPSASHEGYVDVMLVAARKERIDERLTLADAAGLRPLIIDVDSQVMTASLALLDLKRQEHQNQPIVLLQLCSEGSHCYVMLNGLVIFEREIGLSLPRSDQEKSRAAMESIREAICQELTRALQLFSTSTQHASVAHIYIAGSIYNLGSDLAAFVERRVGISSSLPNPFADMHLPSLDLQLQEDAPACLVASMIDYEKSKDYVRISMPSRPGNTRSKVCNPIEPGQCICWMNWSRVCPQVSRSSQSNKQTISSSRDWRNQILVFPNYFAICRSQRPG